MNSNPSNNKPQQPLSNKPIGCTFCGNTIPSGRILESKDMRSNKITKEIRWTCSKCGNVAKRGPA